MLISKNSIDLEVASQDVRTPASNSRLPQGVLTVCFFGPKEECTLARSVVPFVIFSNFLVGEFCC